MKALQIETQEDLIKTLNQYGVKYSKWVGNKTSKTLQHLWKEIKSKDSALFENNGNLVRVSESVWLTVYQNASKNKVLRERKHKKNGVVIKERGPNHPLTEKKSPIESVSEAIERGILEELGVNRNKFTVQQKKHVESVEMNSLSYPGLKAQYKKMYGSITFKKNVLNKNITKDKFETINKHNKKTILWEWINNPRNTVTRFKPNPVSLPIVLRALPGYKNISSSSNFNK